MPATTREGERATRDIVRALSWSALPRPREPPRRRVHRDGHLGPETVQRSSRAWSSDAPMRFRSRRRPGQVIPTAHYMMGGVASSRTAPRRCRPVRGGRGHGRRPRREPARRQRRGGVDRVRRLRGRRDGGATTKAAPPPYVDLHSVEAARERALASLMGRGAGSRRCAARCTIRCGTTWYFLLDRGQPGTGARRTRCARFKNRAAGLQHGEPRYNLTWMDRLNLQYFVLVSRAICAAADARHDSRGAHFRGGPPHRLKLAASRYGHAASRRRTHGRSILRLFAFTRVRPGRKACSAEAAE